MLLNKLECVEKNLPFSQKILVIYLLLDVSSRVRIVSVKNWSERAWKFQLENSVSFFVFPKVTAKKKKEKKLRGKLLLRRQSGPVGWDRRMVSVVSEWKSMVTAQTNEVQQHHISTHVVTAPACVCARPLLFLENPVCARSLQLLKHKDTHFTWRSGGKNDQHYSSRSRVLLRPGASPQGVEGSSCPSSPWLHCNSLLAARRERLVITQSAAEQQELTYKIGKFELIFYCMVHLREHF